MKATTRQFDDVRAALQQHQAVTFIGARGTGKTELARQLEEHLRSMQLSVSVVDAANSESATDFNAALAAALKCADSALTLECLPDEERVRLIIDNCESLHDKHWFTVVQEQWRGLLTSEGARGRLGVILFGRPLFQDVAGGKGSPLLNVGPVLRARPLSELEIAHDFGVDASTARAIRRKTGGHPVLTDELVRAIEGDLERLRLVARQFAKEQERYLIRLAEDHTVAGMAVLADVLDSREPVAESALVSAHFGSSFGRGQDCLADLAGSGLIERQADGRCTVGAEVMREASAAKHFLRAPVATIPTGSPGKHAEAATLLYEIENRLRERVASFLGEVDRAWWPNRVGEKIAASAESRRQDEMDTRVAPVEELHPVMYLHLMEVIDIIVSDVNWNQVFRVRLPISREAFREEARVVGAVRLKIAHNRPITDDDLVLLRLAARRMRIIDD
jgi:hypothetical protein